MSAAPDVTDVPLADPFDTKKRLFKTRQISGKGCFLASHNTCRFDIDQAKVEGKTR